MPDNCKKSTDICVQHSSLLSVKLQPIHNDSTLTPIVHHQTERSRISDHTRQIYKKTENIETYNVQ